MGTLKDGINNVSYRLPAQTRIGRGVGCQVRIDAPYVSGEHAAIRWTGEGWELRDLGSRNGTFLGNHRLDSGQRARLTVGAQIAFGRATETWTLIEDTAPVASAANNGDTQWADDELLLLPDSSAEVCVYADGRGGWSAEAADRVWNVRDGDEITAGNRTWVLALPTILAPTREADWADSSRASELSLRFHVSRDEEHIEVTAALDGHTWRLLHRAHSYLFLTLARARLDAPPDLPASEQGWCYHDHLARSLDVALGQFNMSVFRLRQQLKQAGVPSADDVIERRRGSGEIRLGVGRVEVEAL